MKKLYYFAFGSNMSQLRMSDRVGVYNRIGNWKLKGWDLVFNCGWQDSYANIVEEKGKVVEGVLYELDDYQIAILDRYEAYPNNYEKRYWMHEDGNIVFAYVSVNPNFKAPKWAKPSLHYLNVLIEGCKDNKLLKTYNKLVRFKNENYKLLLGNKYKEVKDGDRFGTFTVINGELVKIK